ncbi:MAG: 1-acyl-sn-glycerol-3-phosphate acyltransferase [Rhodopirellula sp.]|nr:1-acyl-sn-glycerol-3-phosphate acyltransferase [Rhodopirellula sp.]
MSLKKTFAIEEFFSFDDGVYQTAAGTGSWFSRRLPTANFYRQFFWNVCRSSSLAKQGKYDDLEWSRTSFEVLKSLESVGVRARISGVEHVRSLDSPCVFVGNHMSMLETMVLPAIIQPIRDVTFVVKQSLMDYPVFRHVVRARDPIAVTRENPREDFKTVMQAGLERLQKGASIVVFPQTTRSLTFDSAQFNSIGLKLATRAKVPMVPIALKTDAWGNGKWLKDIGRIDPTKWVHFEFGRPILIEGRGTLQQKEATDFIQAKLSAWSTESD